jgi:hypothetical protein
MPRTPTTTNTTVEWEERVTDPDSDSLTLSLVLDAVDDGSGFTTDGTDSSNLSWLSFTKTTNTLSDGTLEVLVNIVADKSGLEQGYAYRFKITADDGTTAVDRTFTLSIQKPPLYSGNSFIYLENTTNIVIKLDASSPYDTKSLSPSGLTYDPQIISNSGIYISPDGTKMYISSEVNTNIEHYTLNTAWDPSTATLQNDEQFDEAVKDIWFKNEGDVFYIPAESNNGVIQYTLTTNWDLTTRGPGVTENMGGRYISHLTFGENGKNFIVCGNDGFVHYTLSTAWDITTKQEQGTLATTNNYDSFAINPNGKVLYKISGDPAIDIFEFDSPYELSSGTKVETVTLPDRPGDDSLKRPLDFVWGS